MATYFATLETNNGYIEFTWNSDYRKNSWQNRWDLSKALEAYNTANGTSVKINFDSYGRMVRSKRGGREWKWYLQDFVYVLNEKNADDQCYGEAENRIDLR